MRLLSRYIIPLSIVSCFPISSLANTEKIYVTPAIGYTYSGTMKNDAGDNISVNHAASYNIAVETDIEPGRVGFFLSHQNTDTKEVTGNSQFTYLHFQSSLRFQPTQQLKSYFGASLGGTFVNASWSEKDLFFSGGLFGGIEYEMTKNASVVLEGRWLANVVKSNTTAICTLPTGNETCKISIDSNLFSQFQTNLGMQFSF
ncbi:outer membrane beta-barrel protein [Photobacterium sanguinicancri]|uniref:Outer membrane protein beta-barrel domain-containing protein n=1 Tax=Photobacterium sanguinicancri TaxID=875932 RepID=A0AAW7Y197_9GAMM|nr:outer membrane beta-barrel protein [Photobacterium sanguinicancri]MDO6542363.1 hypothetical protein [Photobacterium sanguinicancri]